MENSLYNNEQKQLFLDSYPKNTQEYYGRVLAKAKNLEEKHKKDLYDFNVEQMKELLHSLNPLTSGASRTNGRIVSAYLYWAIEEGHKKNDINPLQTVDPEWFDQFVDKDIFLYVSEKELQISIEQNCNNVQDAVIFRLLFEGVQGKSCSELTNLKKQDVDFDNNVLHLTDKDGSTRDLKVSPRCIDYIDKALKQKEYLKKNGDMDTALSNIREFTELVDNDYVLRNSKTRTGKADHNDPVNKHTIYRRIDFINEILGYPHLTAKYIFRSGMLKEAAKLRKEHGAIDKELLQKVAEKFQVKSYWSLKDFVNDKVLNALYGDLDTSKK